MAQKVAIEHDDLEIKLGSPLYLYNSIGEMREYAKEDSNRILAFNPPTVGHTSNGLSVLNKIKKEIKPFIKMQTKTATVSPSSQRDQTLATPRESVQ